MILCILKAAKVQTPGMQTLPRIRHIVDTQHANLLFLCPGFSQPFPIWFQSLTSPTRRNPPTRPTQQPRAHTHIRLTVLCTILRASSFSRLQLGMFRAVVLFRLVDKQTFGSGPIRSGIWARNSDHLHLAVDRTTERSTRNGQIHIGVHVSQLYRTVPLP